MSRNVSPIFAKTGSMKSPDVFSPEEEREFELPKLVSSFELEDDTSLIAGQDGPPEFYCVKFCPYQPLDQDPVFALLSKKHIVLCRLSSRNDESTNPCQIISVIRDDDERAVNCACTWAKDPATGKVLLCVGGMDAVLKVYDVVEGKVFKSFSGHGGEIEDLRTSPADSGIIASCSEDTTIRIWSLSAIHERQPCLCILGANAHTACILSIAFHDTGRYLLSTGHDFVINLWTLPDLPDEPVSCPPETNLPHFSTSDVHSSLVDCIEWHGDSILSRACHERTIVLWKIRGFSSELPPPPQSIAPPNHDPSQSTRSAFAVPLSDTGAGLFVRLLEFSTPGSDEQFFTRFGINRAPGQHAVLAYCNRGGRVFFWDFERLTAYQDLADRNIAPQEMPAWLRSVQVRRARTPRPTWVDVPTLPEASTGSYRGKEPTKSVTPAWEASSETASSATMQDLDIVKAWNERYSIDCAYRPLKPHKEEASGWKTFIGRQVGWSPSGKWCVVAGSWNTALILRRWAESPPGAE